MRDACQLPVRGAYILQHPAHAMVADIAMSSDTALLLSQVQKALRMMGNMCLPTLETLGLYSFRDFQGGGPSFELDSSVADEQGAGVVCKVIGALVAGGALPSLKQVCLTTTLLRIPL